MALVRVSFCSLLSVVACSTDVDPDPYPTGDGRTAAGDTHVGDPLGGDSPAGDPHVGDPHGGDSTAGDPHAGGDPGSTGPLCVFPQALIFPAPAIGVPADTSAFSFGTVSITNCSNAVVGVNAPRLSSNTDPEMTIDFMPFSGTATLVPWETVLVELMFAPEYVADDFSGALEITYGPSTELVTVPLSGESVTDPGTCLLQLGPTLLNPGAPLISAMKVEPTPAGAPVNDSFMLVNVGRTPCTVTNFALAGDSEFSFPYANQVETPTTLAFRQLRLINLRFEASSAGEYGAILSVVGDDGTHTMAVSAEAY